MGRIARSWRLMKQSYRVLMQDKELLVLPILSGLCVMAVLASFAFGMGLHREGAAAVEEGGEAGLAIATFAFYVITYTIGFFFQAAVIAGASQRMAGGNPTLGSALGAASRHLPTLLLWGIVAGTVGMILRAIQDRSQLVGRIVTGLIGAAWSLATFFVVPVIVLEGQGVGTSFKRSWGLFKDTWGESVSGSVGLGLLGFLCTLPVIGIGALLWRLNPMLAGIVTLIGLAMVGIFFSALQGVFVASLYRYATQGDAPVGFDRDELSRVFA